MFSGHDMDAAIYQKNKLIHVDTLNKVFAHRARRNLQQKEVPGVTQTQRDVPRMSETQSGVQKVVQWKADVDMSGNRSEIYENNVTSCSSESSSSSTRSTTRGTSQWSSQGREGNSQGSYQGRQGSSQGSNQVREGRSQESIQGRQGSSQVGSQRCEGSHLDQSQNMNEEVNRLAAELKEANDVIVSLKSDIKELCSGWKGLEAELGHVSARLEESERACCAGGDDSAVDEVVGRYKEELKVLSDVNDNCQAELISMNEEVRQLLQEMSEMCSTNKRLEEKNDELQLCLQCCQDKQENHENLVAMKENMIQDLTASLEEAQAKVISWQVKALAGDEAILELEKVNAKMQVVLPKLQEVLQRNEELSEYSSCLQSQLSEAQVEAECLREKIYKVALECADLDSQLRKGGGKRQDNDLDSVHRAQSVLSATSIPVEDKTSMKSRTSRTSLVSLITSNISANSSERDVHSSTGSDLAQQLEASATKPKREKSKKDKSKKDKSKKDKGEKGHRKKSGQK